MSVIPYDRLSAYEYAKTWAYKRNPKYYNFDSLGGDCTNFASQCIFAGCKIMNYTPVLGWYYNNLNDRTPSWTGVDFLFNFLNNNTGVGPFGKIVNFNKLNIGDIIFLRRNADDLYHTLFVSGINNGEIFVASHTIDSFDRNLFSYQLNNPIYFHIEGVKVY